MAKELTDLNFEETIRNGVVVVDFWATWCAPCKRLVPIVEKLADEFNGRAIVGKLNVDENREIPMQYGIMSIPTLLFFKNGQLVNKSVGLIEEGRLRSMIEELL